MNYEDDRAYHQRRARAELDLAYRASCSAAAAAHLRLSAMHMAELREPHLREVDAPAELVEACA